MDVRKNMRKLRAPDALFGGFGVGGIFNFFMCYFECVTISDFLNFDGKL